MSTLSVSEIRKRIAAAIADHPHPATWVQSKWTYEMFPQAEPSQYAHLAYTVGSPGSDFAEPYETIRHKRGDHGGLATSEFGIRWTYRLRGDAAIKDYDEALEAGAELLKGLTAISFVDMHLWVDSLRQTVVGDGAWLLGEVRCTVQHRIAIQ